MAGKVNAIPSGYEGATPYLIIKDAARALEFYQKAFGATEIMRVAGPGGSVGHAEIKIGKAIIMLADEFPEMNCKSPQSFGGSPVSIIVYVCVCARRGHVRETSRRGRCESDHSS
ncbi:MAG TPA: VOC family protein [Nitrospira sp.]|nr:VOC family protein [Nitrospira sp.]